MERFIGRDEELKHLRVEYGEHASSFVVVSGRRGVGKTSIIAEFLRGRYSLYFLATEESSAQNLSAFRNLVADYVDNDEIRTSGIGWDEALTAAVRNTEGLTTIIVIDEFQNLVRSDPAIPSLLAKLWDDFLSKMNVMLILSGSLMPLMDRLMSVDGKFFGRATSFIEVKPVPFSGYRDFFTGMTRRELVELYAVTGGMPRYINEMDGHDDIFRKIQRKVIDRSRFMYNEPRAILSGEMSERGSYFSILRAIAAGNRKMSMISECIGVKQTGLTKYLRTLMDLGILEREIPVTESEPDRCKMGRYRFKENYLNFWFRFIYPNQGLIESGHPDVAMEKIRWEFIEGAVAEVYRDICFENFVDENRNGGFGTVYARTGRWWDRKGDIDIMALDDGGVEAIFCACVFRRGTARLSDYEELRAKARRVKGRDDRRDRFIVYSIGGFSDDLTSAAEGRKDILLKE